MVIGIIFLIEGVIVRTSTFRVGSRWKTRTYALVRAVVASWCCSPLRVSFEVLDGNTLVSLEQYRWPDDTGSSTILTSKVSKKTIDARFIFRLEDQGLKEGLEKDWNLVFRFLFYFFLYCLLCYSVGGLESKYSCKLLTLWSNLFFIVVHVNVQDQNFL